MKRSTRYLAATLAAGAIALSCDEGRLLTEVERGPFETRLEAVSGPDTIFAGQVATYSTAVRVGESTVLGDDLLDWDDAPPGILAYDTARHGTSLPVTGRAPGTATLTATVIHPDLETGSQGRPVTVLLLGVEPVSPAGGDTTVTAIGDPLTISARGIGNNGASADSAGLDWTHKGAALSIAPPLDGRDALQAEAVALGTDTLIFRQLDNLCVQGQCQDTIFVRVQQAPARIEADDTVRLATLGGARTPTVNAFDRNDTPISDPAVAWALVSLADSVIATVNDQGLVTARSNGTARIRVSSGTAADTVAAVVHQFIHAVDATPELNLASLGPAPDTAALTATDSSGAAVTRPFDLTWTSRTTAVVTVSALADGRAVVTAVSNGTTYVVGTAEEVRSDSILVQVAQAVDSVIIAPAMDTLNAFGDTLTLAGEPVDANGNAVPGEAVTWSAPSPGVVDTVDGTSGRVYSVSAGTAFITATAGGVTDSASVLSRQVAADLAVTPASPDTLEGGDQVQLVAAASDSNAEAIASPVVAWTSRDAGIASVDGAGLVTAQAVDQADSTRIVATSGGAADSVTVHVTPATLVTVVVTPDSVELTALGAGTQLAAEGRNQNDNPIPDETFSWASSDPGVADVDATGFVEAVANGTTFVVATADTDGSKVDTAIVVVSQAVDSVAIVPESHTFTAHGDVQVFTASAFDANGNPVPAAAFEFTDDLGGLIGRGAETATTVEATSQDNGIAELYATETGTGSNLIATATVTVTQVPDSIAVTPAVDTLGLDDTVQLTAVVLDANDTTIADADVQWRVLPLADTVIAAVDGTGLVTARSVGTVDVVANPVGDVGIADTTAITVEVYSLEFNGTGDYAEVGTDPPTLDTDADDQWTIEFWVWPDVATGTEYVLHLGSQDIQSGGNKDASYAVALEEGVPRLITRLGAGGGAVTKTDVGSALTAGTWAHVAFVFNSGTATLYVDGVEIGSTSSMNVPKASTASLFIGARSAAAGFLDGRLDDLRFWSTARTGTEIANNRSVRLDGTESGLLAYWDIEGGTGNPADLVSGIVATLNGAVWLASSPF